MISTDCLYSQLQVNEATEHLFPAFTKLLTLAAIFPIKQIALISKATKSKEEEIAADRFVFDGRLSKSNALNWKQYITSLPKPVPSILVF